MKLLKPISCRREIGRGNVNSPDTLVESLVEGFSDGSSILPASTKLSGQVEKTCPLLFAQEYGKIYFNDVNILTQEVL